MKKLEIPYEMKLEAVKANLNKMIREGYFSICGFESCCKTVGVHIPTEVNDFLRPLHCVHFADMTAKMRKYVLELMVAVYNQEPAMYVAADGEIKGFSVGFELDEKQESAKLIMHQPITGEKAEIEE
jgi:hypothetical protein